MPELSPRIAAAVGASLRPVRIGNKCSERLVIPGVGERNLFFGCIVANIHFRTHILTDIIRNRSLKIFVVFWLFFSVVPILKCTPVLYASSFEQTTHSMQAAS